MRESIRNTAVSTVLLAFYLAVATGCGKTTTGVVETDRGRVAPRRHVVAGTAPATQAPAVDVAAILAKIPAASSAEGRALLAQVVDAGPRTVRKICALLAAPDQGGDTKARFALHGLALYVIRPDAEAEREMFERALISALAAEARPAVKAFLIRQLQLVGKDRSVSPLSKLLADQHLSGPATQALVRIRTPRARAALAKALRSTHGERLVKIIRALGRLREQSSALALLPHASSKNTTVRRAAWFALANIGDASAVKTLARAAESQGIYERAIGTKYYLLLARRLAEAGKRETCAAICRKLIRSRTAPQENNVVCAALATLTGALRTGAINDLLAAADHKDRKIREAALLLAQDSQNLPGKAITQRWMAKARGAAPETRAAIVAMLGRRRDRAALPTIITALTARDTSVRVAAVAAISHFATEDQFGPLMAMILKSKQSDEIRSAKAAILRLPGERLVSTAAKMLPNARPPARIALIEILAARGATAYLDDILAQIRHESESVRAAAIKAIGNLGSERDLPRVVDLLFNVEGGAERSAAQNAVVALARQNPDAEQRAAPLLRAMRGIAGSRRALLLGILPRIGGTQALQAIIAETKSSDAIIQVAAVRALAAWDGVAAAPELLEIVRGAKQLSHHVLALRGYVQIVERVKQAGSRLWMLKDAMAAARRAAEKKLILSELAKQRSINALKFTATFLNDKSLQDEAVLAAVKISCPAKRYAGLSGPGVAAILREVIRISNDAASRERARKHLASMPKPTPKSIPKPLKLRPLAKPDKDGFIPLFNGKDLTGWVGTTQGYVVQGGVLICKKNGGKTNLFTAHQFDDFILRFEFKLTPGANNGLGIRSPLRGDAAYAGMELQILDNSAPRFKKLKPHQVHGSIYGVVPAKRGHLKPVGEWNAQEVRAAGSQITVILNGTTILDVDVSRIEQTPDGRGLAGHPGLARRKGHIGFLGHGSRVEFRGIRIKLIEPYTLGPHNLPPSGFAALFNGRDLTGWKGLVGNPESRAKMSAAALAAARQKAETRMRKYWKVVDGILACDAKGENLCTVKEYGDFELLVDWKIQRDGDSGIYLRGSPQVQIWDAAQWSIGSGGLHNNRKNPRKPLKRVDFPVGRWNRFRIKMIGERVTVWLNEELVVDNVVMENYWNGNKPIYSTGQIELQSHRSPLWFRNIFIREIPR